MGESWDSEALESRLGGGVGGSVVGWLGFVYARQEVSPNECDYCDRYGHSVLGLLKTVGGHPGVPAVGLPEFAQQFLQGLDGFNLSEACHPFPVVVLGSQLSNDLA